MPPTLSTCSTCKYWEKILDRPGECCGYCHRLPPPRPELPQKPPYEHCPYPTTHEHEWCGEYVKV